MRMAFLYLLIGGLAGIGLGYFVVGETWVWGLLVVPALLLTIWCIAGLWLYCRDWEAFKRSKWYDFSKW